MRWSLWSAALMAWRAKGCNLPECSRSPGLQTLHAPFQSTLNVISSLGPVDVATVETGGLFLVKSIMGAETDGTKDELAEISLGGTLGTFGDWNLLGGTFGTEISLGGTFGTGTLSDSTTGRLFGNGGVITGFATSGSAIRQGASAMALSRMADLSRWRSLRSWGTKSILETFGGAIGTETVDTETLDDALGGVLGAGNGGKSLGGVFGTGTGTTGIARDPLEAEPEADTLSPSLKSGNSSDFTSSGSPPDALAACCFATKASARSCCFFALLPPLVGFQHSSNFLGRLSPDPPPSIHLPAASKAGQATIDTTIRNKRNQDARMQKCRTKRQRWPMQWSYGNSDAGGSVRLIT